MSDPSDPPVLLNEEDEVIGVFDNRYRKKYGTVIHSAHIERDEDGFYAVVLCDTDCFYWIHESEDDRLDLIQSDGMDVTCQSCLEMIERFREEDDG